MGQMRKAECGNCRGERICEILSHHRQSGEDGGGYYQWRLDWYLLRCRGCEYVFVQTVSCNSEEIDHSYDYSGATVSEPIETLGYWPALAKRQKPDWITEYGIEAEGTKELNGIIREVYIALDTDLAVLAAIGMRTCFDVAAINLGVNDSLSFAQKIDALEKSGKIGSVDKSRIEVLIDAGSASVHRGWTPSTKQLHTLVELLEQFLFDAFVRPSRKKKLDQEADKLKENVPQRSKKPKVKKKTK